MQTQRKIPALEELIIYFLGHFQRVNAYNLLFIKCPISRYKHFTLFGNKNKAHDPLESVFVMELSCLVLCQ